MSAGETSAGETSAGAAMKCGHEKRAERLSSAQMFQDPRLLGRCFDSHLRSGRGGFCAAFVRNCKRMFEARLYGHRDANRANERLDSGFRETLSKSAVQSLGCPIARGVRARRRGPPGRGRATCRPLEKLSPQHER
jgi:hypothetical protein